jgi:hypothetical protein
MFKWRKIFDKALSTLKIQADWTEAKLVDAMKAGDEFRDSTEKTLGTFQRTLDTLEANDSGLLDRLEQLAYSIQMWEILTNQLADFKVLHVEGGHFGELRDANAAKSYEQQGYKLKGYVQKRRGAYTEVWVKDKV